MSLGPEQVADRMRGPALPEPAPAAFRGLPLAAPGSLERQLGNNAMAARDGDRVPVSSPDLRAHLAEQTSGPAEPRGSAADRRQTAHKHVAAVLELLRQYVKNVATAAAAWHELASPSEIQAKCEAVLHFVGHLEVSLANGSPITDKEWATRLARCGWPAIPGAAHRSRRQGAGPGLHPGA